MKHSAKNLFKMSALAPTNTPVRQVEEGPLTHAEEKFKCLNDFEMSASRAHEVNEFTLGCAATSKKISNHNDDDAMMPNNNSDQYDDLNEFTLMGGEGDSSSIHHG